MSSHSHPLPYTPEYAKRTSADADSACQKRAVNASGFYIHDLPRVPLQEWPPEVPAFDTRGNPSAATFESWKKATDSRTGIAGNYFSWKGHGRIPCHSLLERRHLSYLEMNPNVLEIRAQYPEWDRQRFHSRKRIGLRLMKSDIMTIDFVITIRLPGQHGVHYHAISTKPFDQLNKPAVLRRHEREASILRLWGCTHEIMTEFSVSKLESANNDRLFAYMSKVECHGMHIQSARKVADFLLSASSYGTCDHELNKASRKLGLDLHATYRYFAVANFLGYLALDHRHPLLPNKKLNLLKV